MSGIIQQYEVDVIGRSVKATPRRRQSLRQIETVSLQPHICEYMNLGHRAIIAETPADIQLVDR